MISIFDLAVIIIIAHLSGVVASELYRDAVDSVRFWRAMRRARRQAVIPTARVVPSYRVDHLAELNRPAVLRRRRVIDIA